MKFGVFALILLAEVRGAELTTRPALNFVKTIAGRGSDAATAVATDSSGNVYLAGTTASLDFPVRNAFQPHIGGSPLRATADGGKTWTTPGISDPVYAVAGSPKAPAVVYAGTAHAMYKSLDAGKTWALLPSAGEALVNALWVDAGDPSVVHAATSKGMRKSTDAGATWGTASTAPGNFLALAAHPSRPSTLFAATNVGYPNRPTLYRSTDNGATWSLLQNSPLGPFTLACDSTNPDVLYAGTSSRGFAVGGNTSIYKSVDAGDHWTLVSRPRLAISTFALAAAQSGVFTAGPDGVLRSTDGGATWVTAITYPADSVAVAPDGRNIYANTIKGVFANIDGKGAWSSMLPVRQIVETIAVVPTVPATVFVGAEPGRNIFVSKWSADGKEMLYSTYLGGSYYDYATGIAVDRQGNAYVTGYTYSTDFPVTPNAIRTNNAGNHNAFLAKIGSTGELLLYSTYLGGSASDAAFAIALDAEANVYLTGYASSPDFPIAPGAIQRNLRDRTCPTFSGSPGPVPLPSDAFVAKIDTNGIGLRYSTYLGGGCDDEGIGIAVDSSGSAYVAGMTGSQDFPTTPGVLQPKFGSGVTGFLAKLSPQGSALAYATYLGSKLFGAAMGVAVDAKGAAYVTGSTVGIDQLLFDPGGDTTIDIEYPRVGLNATFGGAAFVVKLDPSASTLQSLKYLGGTWGAGTGITLDSSGNVWVAGMSISLYASEPFPTVHPFQAKDGNGFVCQIAPDGLILFSSLLEAAQQIAIGPEGNVFVAGSTSYLLPEASSSALLVRIDRAVPSAITLEEPHRAATATWEQADAGLAPGEIVVMTGTGLGPEQEAGASFASDGKLATSLSGTSVTFAGVPMPLLSVQARKIVGIVPFLEGVYAGPALQVQRDGAVSNSILLPLQPSAIEVMAAINADGSVNSPAHPALAGSVVSFYGAGFGLMDPSVADGGINQPGIATFVAGTLVASVNEQDAQVLYAGPAPGMVAGIVQVNVRIPVLPGGSYPAFVGWNPLPLGDRHGLTLWVR